MATQAVAQVDEVKLKTVIEPLRSPEGRVQLKNTIDKLGETLRRLKEVEREYIHKEEMIRRLESENERLNNVISTFKGLVARPLMTEKQLSE